MMHRDFICLAAAVATFTVLTFSGCSDSDERATCSLTLTSDGQATMKFEYD